MVDTSVKTYFEKDHDRLDELFRQYLNLNQADYPKAKKCFKEFKFGLQGHIVWEEEILFPLLERKMGSTLGPTQVMRMEHRQIHDSLESIHKKVQEQNPDSDQEEQMLLAVLSAHNQKEENILYPAIDRSMSDADRAQVFNAMKNVPEDRYQFCCKET
jgi:regulator of cell morphogenesis and NO signaling